MKVLKDVNTFFRYKVLIEKLTIDLMYTGHSKKMMCGQPRPVKAN